MERFNLSCFELRSKDRSCPFRANEITLFPGIRLHYPTKIKEILATPFNNLITMLATQTIEAYGRSLLSRSFLADFFSSSFSLFDSSWLIIYNVFKQIELP